MTMRNFIVLTLLSLLAGVIFGLVVSDAAFDDLPHKKPVNDTSLHRLDGHL